VAAAQVAAVLLVAAAANDYGYFYGSWRDLWGGLAQSVTGSSGSSAVIHGVAASGRGPLAVGGVTVTSHGHVSQSARASRGLLETVVIRGAISGLSEQAHIYLPPQYFQQRYAHLRFPALEVLTGYPGSNKQLIGRLHYERLLLRDLHRHTAGPMVLVMMRSAVVYPRDTECTDVPGGPQVQTFFAQDVPQQIAGSYRVIPNGWGTVGDSTGGYCAAKIAMMNPYTFHAAASLSGYFTTLHDNTTGNLWGGSAVVRNQNNLDWRLRHMPAPPVSMLLTISRDEGGPLGIQNSRRFMALARPPMRISSIIEAHGGHNFTTWLPEIPKALGWLSSRLPPPGKA
jgi:enterochelin esterase-like enzyme